MEEPKIYRVDKQFTSLASISAWTSLACIGLLAIICLVKYFQGGDATAESGNTTGFLPLQTMLYISVALSLYLVYRFFAMRKLQMRLQQVYLRIDGETVTGISLANPLSPDHDYPNGRPFSIQAHEIREVELREVRLMKQNTAPAIALQTDGALYVVPALENIREAKQALDLL